METDGQQQQAPANESDAFGNGARPSPIRSMSLYEQQAVQALQALQRQPHAAQYFQQLMLQQHIDKAQVNNTVVTGGTASSATDGRAITVATAATTSTVSRSLLLSGGTGGRGQMFLRVNRTLRAPISSQLIFMPGGVPTTVAVTSLAREVTTTTSSGSQTDSELVSDGHFSGKQSSPVHRFDSCLQQTQIFSGPKCIKMETSEKGHAAPNKSTPPPPFPIKIPTYPPPSHLKSSAVILHGTRTLTTRTLAPAATHALVLTSASVSAAGSAQTLVVQPLQKRTAGGDKVPHVNGPVPIQPKTLHGLPFPLQLPCRTPPPIALAPPPTSLPLTPRNPVHFIRAGRSQETASIFLGSSDPVVPSGEGGVLGPPPPAPLLPSQFKNQPLSTPSPLGVEASVPPADSDAPKSSKVQPTATAHQLYFDDDSYRQPPPSKGDASTSAKVDAGSPTPPFLPPPASKGVRGVGEKAPPPKAVVKPHVLTHVIDGFVIQEGAQPFPVCGPIKDHVDDEDSGTLATGLKCQFCTRLVKGTKRFCSTSCSKRNKLSFVRRPSWEAQSHVSNSEDEDIDLAKRKTWKRPWVNSRNAGSEIASRMLCKRRSDSSHSDSEEDASCYPPNPPKAPPSPAQWTVEQVSQFICSLQGCEDLASLFLSQEIDGQALLLLTEEHLLASMNIKLGPALKICAHIDSLRG
ncbi:uncharacterized protein LOC144066659 isoform X2 [Stigmatopora argus]